MAAIQKNGAVERPNVRTRVEKDKFSLRLLDQSIHHLAQSGGTQITASVSVRAKAPAIGKGVFKLGETNIPNCQVEPVPDLDGIDWCQRACAFGNRLKGRPEGVPLCGLRLVEDFVKISFLQEERGHTALWVRINHQHAPSSLDESIREIYSESSLADTAFVIEQHKARNMLRGWWHWFSLVLGGGS
jgi:hypothetical protein